MELIPARACAVTFPLPLDRPFTRTSARRAGVSDSQLARMRGAGVLRRLVRGVYVGAQAPDTLALRVAALGLVVPPDAFAADHTAAWLHAGDVALPPNADLQVPSLSVFRPADGGRLRHPLTRSGERTVRPGDLVEVEGMLVTTPLRTYWDLGRLQKPDAALAGMDQMLRLRVFSHDEALSGAGAFARQRGVVQLRALGPLADGRAQSFGESALRRRWYDAGLPRPELQVPVWAAGRVACWLDMGLQDVRFAAEYDGERWHSSSADRRHDQARRDWLHDQHGWQIEVLRRADVFGQHQDAIERLAAAHRRIRSRRSVVDLGSPVR